MSRRGCCGQGWKGRMTKGHKSFESAVHVQYLYCGDEFIGYIVFSLLITGVQSDIMIKHS